MKFLMNTKLIQGKRNGNSVEVEIEDDKGRHKITTDYVLVAIGRKANTNGL
jgi:pyruvate/2-oxoglutarate dehydrogenase complex dihydrolipoamide dehydrogenase (E3) component